MIELATTADVPLTWAIVGAVPSLLVMEIGKLAEPLLVCVAFFRVRVTGGSVTGWLPDIVTSPLGSVMVIEVIVGKSRCT